MPSGNGHPLLHYRREFPLLDRRTYLNSCSLGALSRRSRRRVADFLDEWDDRGAAAWYDVWWERLSELRSGYAWAIGARAEQVALHASVSTATGVLGSVLDYARRPKVVTTALDFPTVAYQWLAKRPLGIEVEIVPSSDGVTVSPADIAAAVDDRTALVATSHVYFTSGAVQDVAAVAAAAHARGAFCYVDGYQAAGQMPVDVHALGVDFYSAGGLKWLLGGPGITFLYAHPDRTRALEPTVTGWFAHQRQFTFDPTAIVWHDDARRFEQGTPALGAVHMQLGGLEILREIGLDVVRAVTAELVDDLIARARDANLRPKVAETTANRAAIVMIPSDDPDAAVRRLADRRIVVDARPGHVRISPFFYNTEDENAAVIEALRR